MFGVLRSRGLSLDRDIIRLGETAGWMHTKAEALKFQAAAWHNMRDVQYACITYDCSRFGNPARDFLACVLEDTQSKLATVAPPIVLPLIYDDVLQRTARHRSMAQFACNAGADVEFDWHLVGAQFLAGFMH